MFRKGRLRRASLAAVALVSMLLATPRSEATWSIILVDTRTGEVAIGCATCLTNFDLRQFTPVVLTGIGAGAAQASVNGVQFANRTLIRDRLAMGFQPAAIMAQLASADGAAHSTRQYGIVDVLGRRATFTGTSASQWAGGLTGSFEYTYAGQTGTVHYAVQGNILTGPNVVQAAIDAARDTPGDLPQRLMAAMEAARAGGGDGRCSCSTGNPTGCGSPPPGEFKSAHVGYVIATRAGDADLCHGYYRAGVGVSGLAIGDVAPNGRLDVVTANPNENTVSVLSNSTRPTVPFPMLNLSGARPVGSAPRSVVIADFTGDGIRDIVSADSLASRISLLRNLGESQFAPAVGFAVGAGPIAVVASDFDGQNGPDAATANATARTISVLLNNGLGTGFLSALSLPLPSEPRDLIAADINGDGFVDLIAPSATQPHCMVYLGDGAGGFTAAPPIPLPGVPVAVAAADFNADGRTDLAAVLEGSPPKLAVLLNGGPHNPGFSVTEHPLVAAPNHIAAGDISGDGAPDLVIPMVGGRFVTYFGSAAGAFTLHGNYDVTTTFAVNGAGRVALGDLDGDGDLDLVFTIPGFSSVAVAQNLGGGVFVDGGGTASGDYFLNLNVANQPADAVDPVMQLEAMFAEWRSSQTARPDAVQSLVTVPPDLYAGNARAGVMTVALRDWRGEPITAPVSSLTVMHAPGSTPRTAIGAITETAPNVYEVYLAPLNAPGTDRFIITADDGVRPVVLMPRPAAVVARCPADWNTDDAVNSRDLSAFITAWIASVTGGGLAADFNGDGVVNPADLGDFLARWLAAVIGEC